MDFIKNLIQASNSLVTKFSGLKIILSTVCLLLP